MGTMMKYGCLECGRSKQLHLGVGMMYPRVCDDMKQSIANGEYGSELKAAYESCELPAVRPEEMVYMCPSCGNWEVHRDASVYEPSDVEAAKKEKFGIKTVEEWGGIPYISGYEIESGKYRLVSCYTPACPNCGDGMAIVAGDDKDELKASELKCPECGSLKKSISFSGYWD